MLYAFLEISLSLLAALGLCALVWLCRGWLLEPEAGAARFYAVIPAGGDGGGLELAVKRLRWLRLGEAAPCDVVIADRGLDSRGRALAEALAAREAVVVLLGPEELTRYCV